MPGQAEAGFRLGRIQAGPVSGPGLQRVFPCRVCQRADPVGHGLGVGAAGGAIEVALLDALDDAGQTEVVIGQIPVPLPDS